MRKIVAKGIPGFLVPRAPAFAYAALAAALVLLMPSAESFWIDEVTTVEYARLEPFGALAERLATDRDSLTQMPLGCAAFWLWRKLGASSEWTFRSLNCIWALLAAWAMALAGRRLRLPLLPAWLLIQPFLWFYANEVRPYILQVAGSAWLLHGLVACLSNRGRGAGWAWSLLTGGVLAAGASILASVPIALTLAILLAAFRHWQVRPSRGAWIPLAAAGILLALLAGHHAATLWRGAGGVRLWETGIQNAAFSGYELLGFLGLGPARLEIREAARAGAPALGALFRVAAPALGLMAALYLLLLLPLRRGIDRARQPAMGAVAAVAIFAPLIILALARLVAWPFWGRHLAPVFPFIACLTAWLAARFYEETHPRWLACNAPTLLALLLLASSLALRFSPRHRKDDYRQAAAVAMHARANGQTVWWAADLPAARYYGVPFDGPSQAGGVITAVPAENAEWLANRNRDLPDLVIASKPNLFDPDQRLELWLATRQYRGVCSASFAGFAVWTPSRRASPSPSAP